MGVYCTPTTMEVTNIEYLVDEGYDLLKCKIDGIPALIGPDISPTLFRYGIIPLGKAFEGKYQVEEKDIPEEIREMVDTPMDGYTNDPKFFAEVVWPWVQHIKGIGSQ